MCGLVGFVSYANFGGGNGQYQEKRRFLEQGLYLSATRGWEGTGLAFVMQPDKQAEVYKRSVCSRDFLDLKETERMMWKVDRPKAVIGHTRSATRGYVEDYNAHPFQFDHITLAHNGTLNYWKGLTKNCDIEVDSAYIACAMAEVAEERELLEKLNGSYSLIWHNARDKSFNFARNDERPMYWINIPAWKGFAYASEMGMLGWLLDRNGIKTEGDFRFPALHTQYKIFLDKEKMEVKALPFDPRRNRSHGPPSHHTPHTDQLRAHLRAVFTTPKQHNGSTSQPATKTGGMTKPEIELWANSKAGSKGFHLKNSGRPASNKAKKKATRALSKLGLKYDTVYGANVMLFQPYKNQDKIGAVFVNLIGEKVNHLRAEIHNVTLSLFDAMHADGGQITGRAVNVRHYNKDKAPTVVLELEDYDDNMVIPQRDDNELFGPLPGPNGELIARDVWEELVEDGCVSCDDIIDPEDADKVLWAGPMRDQPICPRCGINDDHLRLLGIIQ